jgi:histone deacetylase complex regulatory component SIN3
MADIDARPRRAAASFTVACPGVLEVLSIGKGDLKIEIGDSNEDRAKAQRIIEEMLRKGYTLFVETPDGLEKVTRFLPDEMAYVVADVPELVPPGAAAAPGGNPEPAAGKPAREKRGAARKVPVAGSKTTAIGRTAGG